MNLPDMNWSDLPVWSYYVVSLVVWYLAAAVVVNRLKPIQYPTAGDTETNNVMCWLFSPVLVPVVVALFVGFTAAWVLGVAEDPPWKN